ncbi:hypothetical protein I5535_06425 [Rhodobacteraceae bacterium F11138]|nr:hypothetical protein [Rhodobacteraceae bacterium F11138]
MFEAFLVTTSTAGLQPLGSAAQRSFELVRDTVRARVGEAHARLFAEPVATPHGDKIDWYAPFAGTVVPNADLSESEQGDLRAQLGALIADIQAEAMRLGDSEDAQDQRLSEALTHAIEIPDETMIHAVRDANGALHPVLVHWAWLRDAQQSVRGVLTAMVPRHAVGQAAAIATEVRQPAGIPGAVWWWLILLGWVLLAGLLACILYVLIAPCGLNPGRFGFCPPPESEISAIPRERAVLEDEIARVQRELALLDRNCQPTIPIVPAPPLPPDPSGSTADKAERPAGQTDPAVDAIARRLAERGAERGELNFVLSWTGLDDVDLSVICPEGQEISSGNRSGCGGVHDLGANGKAAQAVSDPLENVVFDQVTPGLYKVRIRLAQERTQGEKSVQLHVLRRDGRSRSYSGTVSSKTPEWSLNISISR